MNRRDSTPAGPRQYLYFEAEGDDAYRCLLCPHTCALAEGRLGRCGVRGVRDGSPWLPHFGRITAAAADPVEKKPLYHFFPGESVWSAGFFGCNMRCPFCQNYRIARSDSPAASDGYSPEALATVAAESGYRMLAFTYSEPSIHIEYLTECARAARAAGLKTVLVSNGNLCSQPAEELLSLMDGVNVDLKSWDPEYYRKTLGGNRDSVVGFIRTAFRLSWVEVTTLVVPGDNDDEDQMGELAGFIASVSPDIPLHLSAYHPSAEYTRPATSFGTMRRMESTARRHLNFVYLGNMRVENDTECPECGSTVIRRQYYHSEKLMDQGRCRECGYRIPGVFI